MASDCSVDACPAREAFLSYQPSLAGNGLMVAAWATLIPVTFVLGYQFKMPVFASTLATGFLLEVVGSVGRLLLQQNGANQTAFVLFLLGTVLGPILICTAIFLVLPHVILVYGEKACSIPPRYLGIFFSSLAVLAFVLGLVGVIFATFGIGGAQVGHFRTMILSGFLLI